MFLQTWARFGGPQAPQCFDPNKSKQYFPKQFPTSVFLTAKLTARLEIMHAWLIYRVRKKQFGSAQS